MKRFVICMPSRRDQAINELDKLYRDEYEVFDAIIASPGSFGISESFKAVIRANYEEPEIHVFEDDVLFTSDRSRIVFEENMPEEFDLYLGGCYVRDLEIKHQYKNNIELNDFASLHSVVIKKRAYDFFLSHEHHVLDNIDRWIGTYCKDLLRVFLCNPMVAIQKNGHSFNRGRSVNYDDFLIGKNILR